MLRVSRLLPSYAPNDSSGTTDKAHAFRVPQIFAIGAVGGLKSLPLSENVVEMREAGGLEIHTSPIRLTILEFSGERAPERSEEA